MHGWLTAGVLIAGAYLLAIAPLLYLEAMAPPSQLEAGHECSACPSWCCFSDGAPTELGYQRQFTWFMKAHDRQYATDELFLRFDIFKSNLDRINAHNAKPNQSYTQGVNQFTDWTPAEFRAKMTGGFKPRSDSQKHQHKNDTAEESNHHPELRSQVDWRSKMGPVRDQGQCGSCWAFSAVGAVEGALSVLKGILVDLSEQELVDCSRGFGNSGCNGGLMYNAFKYMIATGGIASEADYKYTAADGTCKKGVHKASA